MVTFKELVSLYPNGFHDSYLDKIAVITLNEYIMDVRVDLSNMDQDYPLYSYVEIHIKTENELKLFSGDNILEINNFPKRITATGELNDLQKHQQTLFKNRGFDNFHFFYLSDDNDFLIVPNQATYIITVKEV